MTLIIGDIETFPDVKADKEQVKKVLEESAEVYEAWDEWHKMQDPELVEFVISESADLIQAVSNLMAAMGVDDMRPAMKDCYQRNLSRGRYWGMVHCKDCKHARIETHKGDDELVCWHHHPGYVTQPEGFCHRAVWRDA